MKIVVSICHNEGDIQLSFCREYEGHRLMLGDQVSVLDRKLPVHLCYLDNQLQWVFTLATYYSHDVKGDIARFRESGFQEIR